MSSSPSASSRPPEGTSAQALGHPMAAPECGPAALLRYAHLRMTASPMPSSRPVSGSARHRLSGRQTRPSSSWPPSPPRSPKQYGSRVDEGVRDTWPGRFCRSTASPPTVPFLGQYKKRPGSCLDRLLEEPGGPSSLRFTGAGRWPALTSSRPRARHHRRPRRCQHQLLGGQVPGCSGTVRSPLPRPVGRRFRPFTRPVNARQIPLRTPVRALVEHASLSSTDPPASPRAPLQVRTTPADPTPHSSRAPRPYTLHLAPAPHSRQQIEKPVPRSSRSAVGQRPRGPAGGYRGSSERDRTGRRTAGRCPRRTGSCTGQ